MENVMTTRTIDEFETAEPAIGGSTLVFITLALVAGVYASAELLPAWLPNLAGSLLGSEAKAYWYLSRGSALVAYFLVWLSMALGLTITNRMARVWPGGPTAFEIHEYTSIIGLAFGLFHALILMGDRYINYSLAQILVPFASQSYRPIWVGLGQIAIYTWAILVASFYVKKKIGTKTWRMIHFSSFLMFLMVSVHSLLSGTDTNTPWAQWFYWISTGSIIFLLVYRILATSKRLARISAS
jgi:predicted ferric reductase